MSISKMWVEDKNVCFVCGRENQEGMKLPIEVDEKGARFRYVIPEKYQGWVGITHGGIVATMLDELMAWSTKPKGYSTVTAEIQVRFRKPVPVGKEIAGEGWITKEEGRLVFAHSRLIDEKGIVLAEATGKLWKV
ncbi:MAG: PaaI family thioesterase [candidate division WOR-3 bacterium]